LNVPRNAFRKHACDLPPSTRVLRSYQSRAATWLYERDAAFLIAPLGAGKGAAALTAVAELIRDGERRHALVIAPKLVATTVWPTEVALWPHLAHLRIAVLNGTPERRRALLARAGEREVTVIGVDLVPWLVGELAGVADDHPLLDVLIIDETSRLKDPSGKRARALLKVAGRFRTRWGLTGTPRPNSSMDLFMPAAIVTDGALWGRVFVPWQKQHFRPRDPFGREWVALPGAEAKIAASFGTVAMTVADEDMPDLPPLNIVETHLQLPDAVMASYRAMARELLTTAEGRTIEAASPLIATGKLAQLANGFLYDTGNDDAVFVHDLKIEWLRELVESLDGEPLLIAYEFIEDLRTIRRALGEVPVLGGPTSAAESARLVEAWNAGSLPLLAFHPAAAGHGINLQYGGARMAWLSPSWSAELTQQAIARIYRPGQTRHVTVHVCIATRTVDEMKRDRVLGKMSAQEAFRRHLEQI
jgi:SNF2 domain-containing protein